MFIEKRKGRNELTVVKYPFVADSRSELIWNGIKLKVHCIKKDYIRNFKSSFFSSEHSSIYHLWAEVTDTIDNKVIDDYETLKDVCNFSTDMPALLPEIIDYKYQRVVLTNAYLDLLIARYRKRLNK